MTRGTSSTIYLHLNSRSLWVLDVHLTGFCLGVCASSPAPELLLACGSIELGPCSLLHPLLLGWYPVKDVSSLSLATMNETGARRSQELYLGLPCGLQGYMYLAMLCCFLGHIIWELHWKWSSPEPSLTWDASLTCCTTRPDLPSGNLTTVPNPCFSSLSPPFLLCLFHSKGLFLASPGLPTV